MAGSFPAVGVGEVYEGKERSKEIEKHSVTRNKRLQNEIYGVVMNSYETKYNP